MSEKIKIYDDNEILDFKLDEIKTFSGESDMIYLNDKLLCVIEYSWDYKDDYPRTIMHKIFKLANEHKNLKDENKELKQLLSEAMDNERIIYYAYLRREEEIDEIKKQ